jgi:hypothetical protein
MIRKVIFAILALVGLTIVVVMLLAVLQPDSYSVERSRTMDVPPEAIVPLVTDLREWAEWNPWAEIDPDADLEYSDPATGEGAWYTWKGNEDMGSGKMTIVSIGDSRVDYDLEFIEPFESESDVAIEWAASGEGTEVTWSMEGQNNFGAKLASLFVDFQEAIGKDFDDGLANLEAAAAE